MYDQQTIRPHSESDLFLRGAGSYTFHCTGQHFMDRYGEEWVRSGDYLVVRLSDGMRGQWFNCKGLKEFTII